MILNAFTRTAGLFVLGTALSVAPCFSAPVTLCYTPGCIVGVSLTPTGDAMVSGDNIIQNLSLSGTGTDGLAGFSGLTGYATIHIPGWDGGTGNFNTEMLQLDLTGGMMLRESPTLHSTGQTQIAAGPRRIDSFFDIFTELSLDGGQSWMPQMNGSTEVSIPESNLEESTTPEPASWLLLASGATLAMARRRQRS